MNDLGVQLEKERIVETCSGEEEWNDISIMRMIRAIRQAGRSSCLRTAVPVPQRVRVCSVGYTVHGVLFFDAVRRYSARCSCHCVDHTVRTTYRDRSIFYLSHLLARWLNDDDDGTVDSVVEHIPK